MEQERHFKQFIERRARKHKHQLSLILKRSDTPQFLSSSIQCLFNLGYVTQAQLENADDKASLTRLL